MMDLPVQTKQDTTFREPTFLRLFTTLLGVNKHMSPQLTYSQTSVVVSSLGYDNDLLSIEEIVATGNLTLVQIDWVYSLETQSYIAKYGHTHILRWLCSEKIYIHPKIYMIAAQFGSLDTLMFLHEYSNRSYDSWITAKAAQGGHLHVLQWLHSKKYARDNFAVACAAQCGHIEIMEWLAKTGAIVDHFTSVYAATAGQIKSLKWFQDGGYVKTMHAIKAAAARNNLETTLWLLENDWPYDVDTILNGGFSDEIKDLVLNYKK